MAKFNRMLSTLLVTAIMFSGLFTGSTQTTRAQTIQSQSWENVFKKFFDKNEDNQPPLPPASGGGTARSWENIFKDYDPPLPPNAGGSRGGLCAIAPQPISTNTEVWSDRPIFVWRGLLSRIEIRPAGGNKVLWRQTGIGGLSSALYAGEALQPGQTYDWLLFDRFATDDSSPIRQVTFRVMDAKERDRIKVQLQNLEAELKAKGASAEEIAMGRAQYFIQQKLWSDVLREAYSVKNPSAALAKLLQDLPTQLCNKASRPNSVR